MTTTPPSSPPYADVVRDLSPDHAVRGAIRVAHVEMLEELPTHDGTPCVTLWDRYIYFKTDPGHRDPKGPPKMGIQIYDITPGSNNTEHLKRIVRHLNSVTSDERNSGYNDRLDIYGLPMAEDIPEEERVQRCIDHSIAEYRFRNESGRTDYYIPPTFKDHGYQRAIVVVDRAPEEWDDDEGGFLVAEWDHKRLAGRIYETPPPDMRFFRYVTEELAVEMRDEFKEGHGWFLDTYVRDGYLAREIARCVRAARERAQMEGAQQNGDGGLATGLARLTT